MTDGMILASDWSGWGEAIVIMAAMIVGGGALLLGLVTAEILVRKRKGLKRRYAVPVSIMAWTLLIPFGFWLYALIITELRRM